MRSFGGNNQNDCEVQWLFVPLPSNANNKSTRGDGCGMGPIK